MIKRVLGRSALLAALYLLSLATIPSAHAAPKTGADEEMIKLTFPENTEVKLLIEYVSKRLGVNILYDEAVGAKRVTIASPAPIPKSSLMGLFRSVLHMAGLALVEAEQPGWKRVVVDKDLVKIAGRVNLDPRQLDGAEANTAMTQVFQLEHVDTAAVEKIVKPFLSQPGGNTLTIPERRLLVITDYVGNLRRMASMISLMDKAGPKAALTFVPAKHTEAEQLAQQINALLNERRSVLGPEAAKREDVKVTAEPRTNQLVIVSTAPAADKEVLALVELLDVPTELVTKTYRMRYVIPTRVDRLIKELIGPGQARSRYRSAVDLESGMLIVTAAQATHAQLKDLLAQLDVAETQAEHSFVQLYRLTNTTAAQVLATIRTLDTREGGLTAMAYQAGASDPIKLPGPMEDFVGPNRPPAGGPEPPKPPAYTPSAPDGPDTSASAERPAPAATESVTVGEAVVTADTNTNTIIVVAPPRLQQLYGRLIKMLDKRRPQVLIEVTMITLDTSDNYSFGVELAHSDTDGRGTRSIVFSSFGLSEVSAAGALTLSPGIGFNGALLSPGEVDVVVRALAGNANSKVLSAPKLLVNDNSTATLSSVSEAPYTSINASDTVSTTSFAGYASAGTTLTISPHISEGDHLQLQYSVTLNSFTGEGSSGVPPPRQTNNLNSEVTIPDGYGVIVGGLTREDRGNGVSKIPLLGDIPLLGYLFSARDSTHSRSTLFVFIRPLILRDNDFQDLKYLSRRELSEAKLPDHFPDSTPMTMQ